MISSRSISNVKRIVFSTELLCSVRMTKKHIIFFFSAIKRASYLWTRNLPYSYYKSIEIYSLFRYISVEFNSWNYAHSWPPSKLTWIIFYCFSLLMSIFIYYYNLEKYFGIFFFHFFFVGIYFSPLIYILLIICNIYAHVYVVRIRWTRNQASKWWISMCVCLAHIHTHTFGF